MYLWGDFQNSQLITCFNGMGNAQELPDHDLQDSTVESLTVPRKCSDLPWKAISWNPFRSTGHSRAHNGTLGKENHWMLVTPTKKRSHESDRDPYCKIWGYQHPLYHLIQYTTCIIPSFHVIFHVLFYLILRCPYMPLYLSYNKVRTYVIRCDLSP